MQQRRSVLGRWTLVLFLVAVYAIVFQVYLRYTTVGDEDHWWSYVVGKQILAAGTVPLTLGPESLHQGLVWPDHEWMYCVAVAFFQIHHVFWLFVVLSAFVAVVPLLFVFGECVRNRVSPLLSSFSVGAAGFFTLSALALRADSLVASLFVVLVLAMRSRRAMWFAPVVMLVWANLHGSFPLGCVYLLSRVRTRLVGVVVVLSLYATSLNPLSFGAWRSVFHFPTAFLRKYINEWMPTVSKPVAIGEMVVLVLPVVVLFALGCLRRRRRPDEVPASFVFFALAWYSLRFVRWFSVFGLVPLLGLFRQRRLLGARWSLLGSLPALLMSCGFLYPEWGKGSTFVADPVFGLLAARTTLDASSDLFDMTTSVCVDNSTDGGVIEGYGGRVNLDGRVDAFPEDLYRDESGFDGLDVFETAIRAEPCEYFVTNDHRLFPFMQHYRWRLFRSNGFYDVYERPEELRTR